MINSISSSGANIIIDNKNQKSSDNQVKILQHQEMAVQKQIESIKQNDKMDIKTKQELIKPLESQIQSIESQIQQVQMDAMGKKMTFMIQVIRDRFLPALPVRDLKIRLKFQRICCL
ncbi:FlxA-like family protein [Clostridium tyrobutyricum]|uniref:FlxA-like family protein n=1 Tax=Clostridium tyrobutyricum TaxID=1519 RepID=UPI0002DC399C|nr:FlxA-like family protein [Clostridium tyrobutyricum]MEA5007143.1 FlxA-like family protein [Clostridium tyrobutyricum]